MKKFYTVAIVLILVLMLGCVYFTVVKAQTTPLSFPQVSTDLNRPGAGANEWNYNQNIINIPTQGVNTPRLDRYWRFTWLDFQSFGGSAGTYDFTTFDAKMQESISKGQKFSFGVMQQCGGCDLNLQGNNALGDGKKIGYPQWLHNQMQSEATKDFTSGGEWFPNYNSAFYLTALKNLNTAINAHILAGSFNGVQYKNNIFEIDIRGYGDYGEWTNNVFTAGNITVATGDSIISYHVHIFDKFQCVYMMATCDGGQLSNTNVPPAVGFYALSARNSVGPLGWRRDSWGWTDSYLSSWTDTNPTVFGGYHFADTIMSRYKYAPIVGEPADCENNFEQFLAQVQLYHVNSFGNGNFNCAVNATIQNNFRAASAAAGYRILIDSGRMTTTPAAGSVFNVTLYLKNTNGIPPYVSWKIIYEWWNGTTLLQRDTSAFDLKGFLSTSDVAFSSNITLRTVPAGTGYSLHVKVVDPLGFSIPMPLFITGRLADGSYPVRGGITVTSNSGGAVADAGSNLNTSGSSVTLTSAASIGAATQSWTRLSGPNTPSITTPSAVSTTVTGLITGTYVFQVCINGGPCSGQLISTVTVVVNAPALQANAGSNQTITLPTSSVLLTGAASTGTITSYSWTKISGPGTQVIVTPSGTTTAVTGLQAGTYVFGLSINAGASVSNVTVTVLPTPAPVANAGPSQAITLPLNFVTLNGSGSSGTISSYAWTQVSGPNTAAISSPATVTTIVSGLVQGVYIFQLALNGGSSDTAQVVVSPAIVPPPAPSGVNIFTTQTPNSGTLNDGPQGGITGIEIGVKFRTTVGGFITGVRFYKKQDTTTRQIGELYNSAGTRLAQATFTYQGNNGWQVVQFVPAVQITANTTYIVAVFSPSGNYVSTNNYFTGAISNLPVVGLGDGTDGSNGIYKYTATAAFPNATYQKSNYWVDPYFTANTPGTLPGTLFGGRIYFQGR